MKTLTAARHALLNSKTEDGVWFSLFVSPTSISAATSHFEIPGNANAIIHGFFTDEENEEEIIPAWLYFFDGFHVLELDNGSRFLIK